MKKVISLLCAFLLAFQLTGCAAITDPEAPVDAFCQAMQELNVTNMAACTKDGDIAVLVGGPLEPFFEKCAAHMTYTIKEVTVTDNRATVEVEFWHVNSALVIADAFAELIGDGSGLLLAMGGADPELLTEYLVTIMLKNADSYTSPTASTTVFFPCVRTDWGWKISSMPDAVNTVLTCDLEGAFESFSDSFSGGY